MAPEWTVVKKYDSMSFMTVLTAFEALTRCHLSRQHLSMPPCRLLG